MRWIRTVVWAALAAGSQVAAAQETTEAMDATELLATTFVPERIELTGIRLEMDGRKVEGSLQEKGVLLNRALHYSPASADLLRKRNNRYLAGTLLSLAGAGLAVGGVTALDTRNEMATLGVMGGSLGLMTAGFVFNLSAPSQRQMIGSFNQWSVDNPAATR